VACYFVSYNSADRAWAEWIAWQIEDAGHTTVVQAWDFRPGMNFVLEMDRAAATSDHTIAVLSPGYLGSRFGAPEWAAAFVQDPTGEGRRLIPVRVREFDRRGLLAPILYIDLVGVDEDAARTTLLEGIEPGRAKPATPPPFPGAGVPLTANRPRYPGLLPSVWRLPRPRNPHFTGREELLAQLEADLVFGDEPTQVPNVQAVYGLGGVGKTQVAVEHAYRRAADYDLVWWVSAEDPAILATDYAALARELGLPEATTQDQIATIEEVRRWLERSGPRWLLVFDNAERWADLDAYLPRTGSGHVLITTRNAAWPGQLQTSPVPVLPESDAVRFLLDRTRQTDAPTATVLAGELGYLPLALEQAAAYVDARNLSLAGYLERFRTQRREYLQRGEPTDYPDTVATTWDLAFTGAADQAPCAADVLKLLAFLAPDAIPLDVIVRHAAGLPDPIRACVTDQVALDDAVVALRRYSLVEAADDQTASVHRLVQAVVRDRLTPDQQAVWILEVIGVLAAELPTEGHDPRTWPSWERLVAHAIAAAQHAADLEITDLRIAKIDAAVGVYLSARGRSEEARPLLERAVALGEAVLGPDHPETSVGLHHLARILKDLADLDGAMQVVERALAIDEAIHGPTHLEVANDLALMGNILRQLGNLSEARARLERALAIREASLDPNAAEVATSLNDLGNVVRQQGDYRRASDHHARALRIHEAAFGPDHPEVGIDCGNLGQDLLRLGELDEARKHMERALTIHEAAYGADHPMVAIALGNLARVLREAGNPGRARELLERASGIDQAAYGPDHPEVAADLDNLANVLQDLGDLEGAKAKYDRVLEIRERRYGPDHLEVATVLNNLAVLLIRQGDLTGAKERLERALVIGEAAYGPDHPVVAAYLFNLANVLQQRGELAEAVPLLERASRIREATLSSDHPELTATLSGLGSVLLRLGTQTQDRPMLQRALALWRRVGDRQGEQATLRALRELDNRDRARRGRGD
jgi:tetratricopeptide (TPR) repeat protein